MKKMIRISAIVCLALMLLSVLLTAVGILLQKPLIELIYGYNAGTMPFQVPVGTVVYALCAAVMLGLLVPVAGSRKIGIWADLILAGLLITVLPAVQSVMSLVQSVLVGNLVGSDAVAASAAVANLCSFTMAPGGLGVKLALVVCGMSIACKLLQKRQEPVC